MNAFATFVSMVPLIDERLFKIESGNSSMSKNAIQVKTSDKHIGMLINIVIGIALKHVATVKFFRNL